MGRVPTAEAFAEAARAELAPARGWGGNDFKIPLAHRLVVSTLAELTHLREA